jgi:hypothetical protein
LAAALTVLAAHALAGGRHVQWADQHGAAPRQAGAGYNAARYDRRVAQPKSILKGSPANRAIHSERAFTRQLGSGTRATMTHRGDIARHARRSEAVKTTLNGTGRSVRFDTSARRAGSGYNNVRYDRRVGQPKSILKGSPANRAVHGQRAFTRQLGSGTRATMTHRGDIARHARRSGAVKSTLNGTARSGSYARHGKTLTRAGKAAAGGMLVTYAAESTLGVDVPDVVDAAGWTYGTLKDPRRAPQRLEKLGRDGIRTVEKAGRTLTNPKQMGRNLENAGKKAVKTASKVGCAVGGLFGAKC